MDALGGFPQNYLELIDRITNARAEAEQRRTSFDSALDEAEGAEDGDATPVERPRFDLTGVRAVDVASLADGVIPEGISFPDAGGAAGLIESFDSILGIENAEQRAEFLGSFIGEDGSVDRDALVTALVDGGFGEGKAEVLATRLVGEDGAGGLLAEFVSANGLEDAGGSELIAALTGDVADSEVVDDEPVIDEPASDDLDPDGPFIDELPA